MTEDFDKSIAFTLKQEGGAEAENDPNDPGGLTKYGISKKAYPNVDIANITLEEAKTIYHRDYWTACRCDELPWPFSLLVFDTAVNQGTTKAKRILQMALDVDVDGVIGDKTIAAAHKASAYRVKKYLALRMAEYARLMVENKALLVFATNWSYRIFSLMEVTNG